MSDLRVVEDPNVEYHSLSYDDAIEAITFFQSRGWINALLADELKTKIIEEVHVANQRAKAIVWRPVKVSR